MIRPLPQYLKKPLQLGWLVFLCVYVFHLLSGPPPEVRLSSLICILTGLYNPVLSLYAIALFGAFYLENPGMNFNLSHLECFVVSALLHGAIKSIRSQSIPSEIPAKNTQFFITCAISLAILLVGSSVTGIIHYVQEYQYLPAIPQSLYLIGAATWGKATESSWTIKSLNNWALGFGIATIAYQNANHWVISRFYKFAALGTVFVCVLGIVDTLLFTPEKVGYLMIPLKYVFSTYNADPLHAGRFSATATHAGWLGQWIILTFPGFLIWFRTSASIKKSLLYSFAASVVFVCLILTLARAPWLGFAGSVLVLFALNKKTNGLISLKSVGVILAAALLALGVSFLFVPELLFRRLQTLFQISDRMNYLYSSLDLLFKFPEGIGLGTHYPLYSEYFLPTYRYYQPDHVEIHNTLFHLFTENSLLILLPLFLFLMGLFSLIKPTYNKLILDDEIPIQSLLASLVGIFIIGFAQYIFYIRPVELFIWILLGFFAGMFSKLGTISPKYLALQRPVLIGSILGGALLAFAHLGHSPWKLDPRYTEYDPATKTYSKWIKNETLIAVDSEVTAIKFTLFQQEDAGQITITWPDQNRLFVTLQPNESRLFEHQLKPARNSFPSRWFRLECEKTWRPVDSIPESKDYRELGVYISGLTFIKSKEQKP